MKKMIFGAAALIAAGFAIPSNAEAAQGCGRGFARDAFGFCRPFYRPRAVFAPVFFAPRPVYRHYGFYGPRHYRPVRYGWHGPRHHWGHGHHWGHRRHW